MDDVIIIGGGPTGIAAGLAAQNLGKSFRILEQGTVAYTVYRFPIAKKLFSTPDHLTLEGFPFEISSEKPTREDLLQYYIKVLLETHMPYQTYEKVLAVTGQAGNFLVTTGRNSYRADQIVLATGVFDNPRRLMAPGEELEKVNFRFHEAVPYFDRDVLVVGGRNSAAETAIFLADAGARVSVSYRRSEFFDLKPWVRPNLERLIQEKRISVHFASTVTRITKDSVELAIEGRENLTLANDAVFCMTYSEPDIQFLRALDLELNPQNRPLHDPETYESSRAGIFIAGSLTTEMDIRQSRNHGARIFEYIQQKKGGSGKLKI